MNKDLERLQKRIANSGYTSRRKAAFFKATVLPINQVLGWVISVICCLRRSMENYRRTPFSMLKVLTAQKKVYFARLICRSVNYVMASVLH